jgi:hypothetical protein
LLLKLNFSNPLYVSITDKKDFLTVNFLQNQIFRAMEGVQLLAENYTIDKIMVPTQVASESDF